MPAAVAVPHDAVPLMSQDNRKQNERIEKRVRKKMVSRRVRQYEYTGAVATATVTAATEDRTEQVMLTVFFSVRLLVRITNLN